MAKWWKSAAVVAFGMAALPASAQGPAWPTHDKPGAIAEPVPIGHGLAGMGVPPSPGAGGGAAAQGDCAVSLPGNLPTAWDEPGYCPPSCYGSIGYLALQRNNVGHGPIAFLDSASGGVDTGVTAPFRAHTLADYNDLQPRFGNGARLTLGYHFDIFAIEASGFHLGQAQTTETYAVPGRIDVPFNLGGNQQNFPIGFNGNNILWLQADILQTSLRTALNSGEVNFRCWTGYDSEISWSIGARYLQIYERFGIFLGDDNLTQLDVFGNPNPVNEMLYTTTVNNHIVGGQLGVEWNKPINCWLAFTMAAKGAWGVNFVDVDSLLKRGDGLIGQDLHKSDQIFSHMYEYGVFADIRLWERARIKAGYNLLWAVHIAEATDQVNFDLGATRVHRDFDGSAFFHGPSVEFQVVF